ncbi:unnamed protein product [Rhizophagus irregularis]|nr:unnamed protein product [Rhizophagus irregularis]
MEGEKPKREKKSVWEHWSVIPEYEKKKHPHAKCKYCTKEFIHAFPERMQKHLDKCQYAPNSAKSHNFGGCMSEKEKKTFENLQDKALSLVEMLTSYPFAIQW